MFLDIEYLRNKSR